MNSGKIIAVDVGNTNIDIAWMNDKGVIKTKKIPTLTANKQSISKILKGFKGPITVCSVVPSTTSLFKGLGLKVYTVGANLSVPIKSLYDKKSIGMDRLVGAWTAQKLFPKTRLVLDFGTAITLDFISAKKVYQGGVILPGIGSTQRALSRCSLLPKKITYTQSKRIIPRNTAESISRGIDKGFSCMLNRLIEDYKRNLKLKNNTPVVVTGGEAGIIIKHLEFRHTYEPFLVFKGLYLLTQSLP